ncbi:uncharacterized protein E1O_17050 [Burkholderiales bacterium GJ-E10]|nr:uncharacterized protein E1O_17050 [Burkholderiales bacterium GJ-E10]
MLAGLQIQKTGYSQPVPIVYGTARVSPTLMYYTDWQVHPHTSSQSTGGGKGGGGGGSITTTTYTYSATVCFLLAEGPVAGVSRIWRNHVSYANPAAVGFTIFPGTYPQTPWGYLSSAHPTEALGYAGSAYAAFANYDLGSNGSLGNHLFEVEGAQISPGTQDANPADVISDFLGNPYYGVLSVFPNAWAPQSFLGDLTALRNWCANNGLLISPAVATQRAAHDWIADWLLVANAGAFWSEKTLKIVPYGSVAAPVYDLGDDDFIVKGSEDPVVVTRKRRADAYNDVSVEYLDRANEYTTAPARVTDQSAIETFGVRTKPTVTLHSICLPQVAQQVAQAILLRELYILNTFQFKLSPRYCLLEPMDVVTITDAMLGLDHTPVLITATEEDASGLLTITAEEFNPAFYASLAYDAQAASGYIPNLGTAPTQLSAATIFLAPPAATASGNEIWMAVTNLDPLYAGSQIYMSYDDVSYQPIGVIYGNSTSGVTTTSLMPAPSAAPGVLDTGNTLGVDLSGSHGTLVGVSQGTLLSYGTLSLVGNEFLAWRDATLTAASHYTLDTLLRGLYDSADQNVAAAGARFVLCDETLFRYPYNPALNGKTLYFKFVAFNAGGVAVQDIAQVPAVAFLVGQQLSVPPAPSGLAVAQSGTTVDFSWIGSGMAGARYELRYVPKGNAANWNDGVLIAAGITQTAYASSQVPPGAWTFLLAAQDSGGNYSAASNCDFTVTDTLTVQATLDCGPQWFGTSIGMVRHWTGKLVPQGQSPTVDDGWDTFDALVPNPVPTCSFESATVLDLGSVRTVRAWAAFAGTLPIPGGVARPQLRINTSSDGVTYSGFTPWSNGTVTARFVEAQVVINTAQGTPCLSEFDVTLDS